MIGAAEILVFILAGALAVFLILAIILIVLMIRLTQQMKTIAGSAERTVSNFEKAAHNVSKFSSPIALGRLFKAAVHRQTSKRDEHGSKK